MIAEAILLMLAAGVGHAFALTFTLGARRASQRRNAHRMHKAR